ncbi:MAG: acyl-CoA dehydrogenase family protein [Lewinellaceae bacterium]|nr:acyl-CoA dehydrogenase family protein [Lewinellaceae bacterium]
MIPLPATTLADSPGIRTLIPWLFVAWSDQVLTPSEVRALQQQAAKLSFLTPEDREVLARWSDPARPPGRDLFKGWEISCKKVLGSWPAGEPARLTDLGLLLAVEAGAVAWATDQKVRAELEQLEAALLAVNSPTAGLLRQGMLLPQSDEVTSDTNQVEALSRWLDGRHQALKDRMRIFLSDPLMARQLLPLKEDHREQVLAWMHRLARQGFGALSYPEAYGGKGDITAYGVVFEMLGFHDISLAIKFGVQFGLWGGTILALGTERHHEAYLKATGEMQLPGCFAMTETGHGSNVRGLETTATFDSATGEFVIHTPHEDAGKEYIGNALHGHYAAVFAQLIVGGENYGVHALVVRLRDPDGTLRPGIRIADCGYKLGLNGVDNGRIWFDKVRVPRTALLDRFGSVDTAGVYHSPIENPAKRFFTMLSTLVGGRVCVPRAGLSAAKSALTIAIKHALHRRQFSPSPTEPETLLLDYPSHQRRLLPYLAKAYALQAALDDLLDRFGQVTPGEDMRELETLAAGLKSYATWFTTHCIQECREACGGKGYLAENRFADLKADTDIFTTFEGDNTVLMQLVAKGVLSDFQKEFNEEGSRAILRYVGRRLGTAISEQNPFAIRNTDPEHLRDPEFHLAALRFREFRLTTSLGQRLRGHIKNGLSAYEAGLRCQTHLLALAEAYSERHILEQFQVRLDKLSPTDTHKPVLQAVYQLFALHTLEAQAGWFLEQEYIHPQKSKAIRRQVDLLCQEIRPNAGALVDAFAIPAAVLGAPIAVD